MKKPHILTPDQSLNPVAPGEHCYLLLDGSSFKGGIRQLYEMGLEEPPIMILKDGVHDGVSSLGPMMIPMEANTAMAGHWRDSHPALGKAVVIHTSLPPDGLLAFFRARVQVFAPDGRILWLRLADARVIARIGKADRLLHANFWGGITGVFYRCEGLDIHHYRPEGVNNDGIEHAEDPRSPVVQPFFQFTEELFAALEAIPEEKHTEVL